MKTLISLVIFAAALLHRSSAWQTGAVRCSALGSATLSSQMTFFGIEEELHGLILVQAKFLSAVVVEPAEKFGIAYASRRQVWVTMDHETPVDVAHVLVGEAGLAHELLDAWVGDCGLNNLVVLLLLACSPLVALWAEQFAREALCIGLEAKKAFEE